MFLNTVSMIETYCTNPRILQISLCPSSPLLYRSPLSFHSNTLDPRNHRRPKCGVSKAWKPPAPEPWITGPPADSGRATRENRSALSPIKRCTGCSCILAGVGMSTQIRDRQKNMKRVSLCIGKLDAILQLNSGRHTHAELEPKFDKSKIVHLVVPKLVLENETKEEMLKTSFFAAILPRLLSTVSFSESTSGPPKALWKVSVRSPQKKGSMPVCRLRSKQ